MGKMAGNTAVKASRNNTSKAVKTTKLDAAGLIRQEAYRLWEKKGRVQGKDVEIWLEAEKKVRDGAM